MDILSMLNALLANDQARILGALIVANLVLAIVQAISATTFDLTRVGDYARTRMLPVFAVYLVASLISWAAPTDLILGHLRDLVFATESAVLIGLLLASLREFGINIPATLAGPVTPPASSTTEVQGTATGGAVVVTTTQVPATPAK